MHVGARGRRMRAHAPILKQAGRMHVLLRMHCRWGVVTVCPHVGWGVGMVLTGCILLARPLNQRASVLVHG